MVKSRISSNYKIKPFNIIKNKRLKLEPSTINKNQQSKKDIKLLEYKTTSEIKVPKNISEQILGQDEGLKIISKAAKQRRNVLLIGEPGTGKGLLGKALAEQLSTTKLVDILCFPNDQDENNPLIRIMPKGKGKELVNKLKIQSLASSRNLNFIFFIVLIISLITPWWIRKQYGDILAAASLIGSMIFLAAFVLFINLNKRMGGQKVKIPKLLVDNSEQKTCPFLDATGSHAGALLGDCLHDPLQSLLNSNKIITTVKTDSNQLQVKEEQISIIDEILKKYEREIIIKDDYKAVFLPKNEFAILGEKNNNIESSHVLSMNKYLRAGELIKITTESGKELIITPEHKVAIKGFYNKIKYIEADKIRSWHKVITLDD